MTRSLEAHSVRTLIAGLLALTAATGCSIIVADEVGELRPDENAKRDVTVSLRDFDPHVGQLLDIQFVENLPPEETRAPLMTARITVDPVPSGCMDMRLLRGAPFIGSRVDFYADLNGNRMLDPPSDGDHSWRLPLDEDGRLLFIHDVQFADITMDPAQVVLNGLDVNITGATDHEGATVTVLLVGHDLVDPVMNIRRRTVPAMYVTSVSDGSIAFTMAGVTDPGTSYDIELRIGDRVLDCLIEDQRTPTVPGEPLSISGELSSFSCAPGELPDCAGLDDSCDAGDDPACEELATECAFVDCAR